MQAVNWTAPALNTVLYRFSADEVTYILTYGRPFSPMSAWGVAGGGPMNDQQISDLIAYLASIQIPMEGCASSASPICQNGHLPTGDPANPAVNTQAAIQAAAEAAVAVGPVQDARRGALQPRPERRRLLVRPLPHEGLVLR